MQSSKDFILENINEFNKIKEGFPHVSDKLELFSGSDYFPDYVNTLILDTRDGKRNGFPKDVAKAINTLLKKHNERFPAKPSKFPDIWADAYKR